VDTLLGKAGKKVTLVLPLRATARAAWCKPKPGKYPSQAKQQSWTLNRQRKRLAAWLASAAIQQDMHIP